MLGTNDLDRAIVFYDGLLAEIGAKRFVETDRGVSWMFGSGSTSLAVTKPFDGEPSTAGNGVMVALGVENRDLVSALHAKAIELGASSEGDPGLRGTQGFFAGYFRDLDGNKLNVFCIET